MLWKVFARQPFDIEDSQEYARECYQAGVIAVGWGVIGDLSANRYSTWDSIFDVLMKKWRRYAKSGARSVAQWTGALWAFRNDVKTGHYVICPDRDSGVYYVGRVCSELYHDESLLGGRCYFSHRREVKWRILTRRQILRIWPSGLPGRRTVTRIRHGEDKLLSFLKVKRRSFAPRSHLPVQPDMEWGQAAEKRAMAWLRSQGYHPKNDANLNLGWDISCGEEKFEVKGRKSYRTTVRLTQNEWNAAKHWREKYTVLVFTAATRTKLKKAVPQKFVDPAGNPEFWRPVPVYEYHLVERG